MILFYSKSIKNEKTSKRKLKAKSLQCHLQRRVSFAVVVVVDDDVVAAVVAAADVVLAFADAAGDDVVAVGVVVVVVEVILVVVVIVVAVVAATVQFYSIPFIRCLKLKNNCSGGNV